MGKKSRKAGKKGDKKAHREKIQQRKDRVEDHLDQIEPYDGAAEDTNLTDGNTYVRPFLEGDRVWFWSRQNSNHDDHGTYRWIVEDVEEPDIFLVSTNRKLRLEAPIARVVPDRGLWTLRFAIGDLVLCRCDCWLPCRIVKLFPPDYLEDPNHPYRPDDSKRVPAYKCKVLRSDLMTDPDDFIMAPFDDDETIRRHPQTFRFSVGDEIQFNTFHAIALPARYASGGWIAGTVSQVDVYGRQDFYAVYKCTFSGTSKKEEACYIAQDDDAHISSPCTNPRDRLVDAIKQGCYLAHICHLVRSERIDITSFQKLFLDTAIEYGNYDALVYLQKFESVDLQRIRDEKGNTILHQMATGPHIARFIRCAGAVDFLPISSGENGERIELRYGGDDTSLLTAKNNNGDSFLNLLVSGGDIRALDMLLSPFNPGLGWTMTWFELDRSGKGNSELVELVDLARSLGHSEMEQILKEYISFAQIYSQIRVLNRLDSEGKEDAILDRFLGISFDEWPELRRLDWARRFVRFCHDWPKTCHPSSSVIRGEDDLIGIPLKLAGRGCYRLLRPLLGVLDHMLRAKSSYPLCSTVNMDEFTQPKISSGISSDDCTCKMFFDILQMAMHGVEHYYDYAIKDGLESYVWRLSNRVLLCHENPTPWLDLIKEETAKSDTDAYYTGRTLEVYKYKLRLLTDDENLEDRLNIVNYLVKEWGLSPSLLDPIRFRQCGVLRWMKKESIIDLDSAAVTQRDIVRSTASGDLQFVGGRRVPKSISVGEFLCFAAVEYDDLQTFRWLSLDMNVAVDSLVINGWNLVHACAFFGRLEFLDWLPSQPFWRSHVESPSKREPGDPFAAHIAVGRGHVHAARILLHYGCPLLDAAEKSPTFYALQSDIDYVREWGEENMKPMQLEKDLKKFQRFLFSGRKSVVELKVEYLKTRCLDYDIWKDCGYLTYDTPGPDGRTFGEMMMQVCQSGNRDFAEWLGLRLSTGDSYCTHEIDDNYHFFGMKSFWSGFDSTNALKDMSQATMDKDVLCWQQKPWATKCTYERWDSHLLGFLAENLQPEDGLSICRRILSKVRTVTACAYLHHEAGIAIVEAFAQGRSRDAIDELREIFVKVIGKICSEEHLSKKARSNLYEGYVIAEDGSIRISSVDVSLHLPKSGASPSYGMERIQQTSERNRPLGTVLAKEGHVCLLRWCKTQSVDWNWEIEEKMIRIASFMNHTEILDFFFEEDENFALPLVSRRFAAALGAAESNQASNLRTFAQGIDLREDDYIMQIASSDFLLDLDEMDQGLLCDSLSLATVSGYFLSSSTSNDEAMASFQVLVADLFYDVDTIFLASTIVLESPTALYSNDFPQVFSKFHSLFLFLVEIGLQATTPKIQKKIWYVIKTIRDQCLFMGEKKDEGLLCSALSQWLVTLMELGVSIQSTDCDPRYLRKRLMEDVFQEARDAQLSSWKQFDLVKQNGRIDSVENALASGDLSLDARDQGGMHLSHVAAAYDRVDILEWLVERKGMSLSSVDNKMRTVLEVAEDSKAPMTTRWIREYAAKKTISSFVTSNLHRALTARRKQKFRAAVVCLQSIHRGRIARKLHKGRLSKRLGDAHRFQLIWGQAIEEVSKKKNGGGQGSWAMLRDNQFDIRPADASNIGELDLILTKAIENTVVESIDQRDGMVRDEGESICVGETESNSSANAHEREGFVPIETSIPASINNILLSSDVVKWLKVGDAKYRGFFIRRLKQLSSGDRSRILAKRLKGSQNLIYESYLEQKSGYRVLWTPPSSSGDELIIWYVAKHKSVSRLMLLIDDSKTRSARQRVVASHELPELNETSSSAASSANSHSDFLINPLGNVPLKLYNVSMDNVEEISSESWTPRLHLTDEERNIVETKGTCLLLGRSGTVRTPKMN